MFVLVRPLGLGAVGLRVLGLVVGALALAIAALRLLIAVPRVRVAILAGMPLGRGLIRRFLRLRLRRFLRRWLIVSRVCSRSGMASPAGLVWVAVPPLLGERAADPEN